MTISTLPVTSGVAFCRFASLMRLLNAGLGHATSGSAERLPEISQPKGGGAIRAIDEKLRSSAAASSSSTSRATASLISSPSTNPPWDFSSAPTRAASEGCAYSLLYQKRNTCQTISRQLTSVRFRAILTACYQGTRARRTRRLHRRLPRLRLTFALYGPKLSRS
jgi:hypothetical protein